MSSLPNEFYDWVLAELYGLATDEQTSQLSALLETSPQARREYIDFLCVYAHLHRRKGASLFLEGTPDDSLLNENTWQLLAEEEKKAEAVCVERSPEEPVRAAEAPTVSVRTPVSKFSVYSLLASAAALIFLIAYAYLSPLRTNGVTVGRLQRTVNAVWRDASGRHLSDGSELYPGPMHLVKGLAEIVLEGGATVLVEGPSAFTLETPVQMYLQEERIVASMKGAGKQAFVVRSPTASLVDYGTEFGVYVQQNGQTETYVYEGSVQIRDSSDPVKFAKSMLLKAGQGAAADEQGRLAAKAVNPYHFVRPSEAEVFEQASKIGGYYRWRSWVYRLHREDPSLAAHYFFERDSNNPERLINAAGGGAEREGVFGDVSRNKPAWVSGRWPQKEAVRFERGKNQVILIGPQAGLSFGSPLTISTWVYFPDNQHWGGHLISCREKHRVNYQFSLFDDRYVYNYQKTRFEFRQYDGAGKAGFYSQPFVPQSGVWYHFAAVYDGKELQIYVNGDLFQTAPYEGLKETEPAEIILGAMKIDGYVLPEGDFDGVVDELMIFRRCLTSGEIRELYENGKP
ncbi:MAG TPA: FecR domain-containing protein [Anaerohalosphaeraceae bacterium]|nr:FecR domain-containing protein [Anaerohalosphaeraceae bacterium]